jgi:hypothetical protein
MKYNEADVLTDYIWDHYSQLMTAFEQEVGKAIIGRAKADYADNPNHAQALNKHFGRINREDINEALGTQPETFRHHVCERLLQEHSDKIYINRCRSCQRIVRTPKARLCTWCGYNWFDSYSSPTLVVKSGSPSGSGSWSSGFTTSVGLL